MVLFKLQSEHKCCKVEMFYIFLTVAHFFSFYYDIQVKRNCMAAMQNLLLVQSLQLSYGLYWHYRTTFHKYQSL